MLKCPGQDPQFWKPEDVVEVPCARCGYKVEFFKTDASVRCPECGTRVASPAMSMGCAQWCEQARRCLGFEPSSLTLPANAGKPLVERLVWELRQALGADDPKLAHARRAFEHAKRLLEEQDAHPRRVLATVLLHVAPSLARRLLEQAGFEAHEAQTIQEAATSLCKQEPAWERDLELALEADLRAHEEAGLPETIHGSTSAGEGG